jgi:hypothetical protein
MHKAHGYIRISVVIGLRSKQDLYRSTHNLLLSVLNVRHLLFLRILVADVGTPAHGQRMLACLNALHAVRMRQVCVSEHLLCGVHD